MSSFAQEIARAAGLRGDLTLLHSQPSVQVYPSPMVLADVVLRDAVLGVSRGMPGFHPADSLSSRCSLRLRVEGNEVLTADFKEDEDFWQVLCSVWVCSDQPAVQVVDDDEALVGLQRILNLGSIPVEGCRALGRYFPWAGSVFAETGATGIISRDGHLLMGVLARLNWADGPVVDGVSQFGFSGCPVRVIVQAGEEPEIILELGFPWGRLPKGVGGGRGVLLEDVRGLEGLRDFLNLNLIAYRAQWVLQHLDAGAEAQGQAEVGFRERVSRVWGQSPLDAADLMDALGDVLPSLALFRADAKAGGDEAMLLVVNQAIVDLVTSRKRQPVMVRHLVELALDKGLAPHIDGGSGQIYWLPLGQFPNEYPPEALDQVVLGKIASDLM